ncbi:hypothetical protein CHS0354_007946 [Potamilus streckersoni]|uniref:Uncharacterized protein n=1 Tax=Potamilus streckersoni TaxID=2493646 RepID=A0AAE0S9T4_9BIVA|nr:hypothetical protein CHS0354_007946 [Potamilus streckersoni]
MGRSLTNVTARTKLFLRTPGSSSMCGLRLATRHQYLLSVCWCSATHQNVKSYITPRKEIPYSEAENGDKSDLIRILNRILLVAMVQYTNQ